MLTGTFDTKMIAVFSNFRTRIANALSGFSAPFRIVILAAVLLLVAVVLLWSFNQLFYYLLAKSYADELSQAYNLNRGFTKALVWASFAAVVLFAGLTFSFSRRKRIVGYVGILGLLIGHGVLLGMRDSNYDTAGRTEKCYVLTRDGIKILNHVGIDPDTGRECRLLTPQMTEKYNAYKNGKRPEVITAMDPAFFDPVSGEPVVWYAKAGSGRIELFDLMGFHPKTGEELKPIDRQTVDEWRAQSSKLVRRIPNRIDPEKFGFFDQVSGAPKVWFWVSDTGDYEFYDGPGFHPKSGEEFMTMTRDKIATWRQAVDAKPKEQERQAQETRDRLAQDLAAKQAALDAKNLADRTAAEELQKQQQAGLDCDRLAANPTDAQRKAAGVTFDSLRFQADAAFDACLKAMRQFPSEQRYQYQLGRAAQFKDKKRAFELFTALTNAGYPAAFDNLGGMYADKNDIGTATRLFQAGVKAGDADSMFSLASLIERGYLTPPNAINYRLALLKRSSELGNADAQRVLDVEYQKAQTAQDQQIMQQQMLEIFGAVVQGAVRR
jgi:signal transduction histidine kinase